MNCHPPRAATDCVDTWILAGISSSDLGNLCKFASRVESGLNELVGKLSTMFGELSCFLATTVDVQKLVQFTIVFFWQKHVMKQVSTVFIFIIAQQLMSYHW